MAISFNTGTTADGGAGFIASLNITIPAGVLADDVVFVVFASNKSAGAAETWQTSSTGTTPTIIGTSQSTSFAGFEMNAALFYLVASATDAGKVITGSFVSGGTAQLVAALAAYTGASTSAPIDVSGVTTATGAGASVTCPSEITGVANDWDLQIIGASLAGSAYSGPSSGFTQRESLSDASSGATAAIWDSNASVGAAGTTIGGGTFTNPGHNSQWAGWTVGLAPAAGPAGAPPPLLVPPGLQSPMVLAQPLYPSQPAPPQLQPAPAPQPVPPGLQSPMALAEPARFSIQQPQPPAQPWPTLPPTPPGLQSPAVLAEPPRFSQPAPPQLQPAPAPQPVPPGLQSPMSLGLPQRPATFTPPPPQPPTGTPAPPAIPPGLQSPMSLAVPARFSIPPAPQQQPAPSPQPVPPGLQSPMSLGAPARPATSAPPPPPVVTQQPPPPLLVPPGLQSPMSLTVPSRPATSAPPAPPVIATPGSWQPHPPGRMSPMSLGLPLVQPPQAPSTPGPGPPTPPIPSGVVPFAQGAPGGDRDPEIRMFRSVMPGEIPATGHAMPRLQGRGYAAPPPARAEDVEVLWEAPPEPAEPPGPTPAEIVLGEAQRAAGALYDLGKILAPEPYVPPSKARCGAIRKLGVETLRCTKKRGHPGMHADRGVRWG